jgi:hypothetical protein
MTSRPRAVVPAHATVTKPGHETGDAATLAVAGGPTRCRRRRVVTKPGDETGCAATLAVAGGPTRCRRRRVVTKAGHETGGAP